MAKEKIKKVNGADSSKSDIWYKVIAIFIAVVLVFGALLAIIKPTGIADYVSMHTTTAIETENYKFNNAHLTYLVYYYYNQEYSTYSQYGYAQSAGFDTSKPLSQQMYWGSATQSWLDYFLEQAIANLSKCLVICEEAKANNVSLTDDEIKDIEAQVAEMKEYAKSQGVSVGQMYGSKGIKAADVQYVVELQALASKYAKQITDAFEYTDEDYEKYYGENKNTYLFADYYSYTVSATYDSKATDDEKKAANEEAKKAAEEIKAAVDGGKDFVEAVYEYEKKLEEKKKEEASKETTADTTASSSSSSTTEEKEKTEEEKKEELKDKVLTENGTYTKDDEFSEWLYAEKAPAVKETKLVESTDAYKVYQVVSLPERHEYNTVNFYAITLSADNYKATSTQTSEEVMKETAAAVQAKVDEFKNKSDKTGEAFVAIAKDFAEDKYVYGSDFMENIDKNTVDSQLGIKGFDDWAFAEGTKAGDIKVFEDEDKGIYAAFYIDGVGMPSWKVAVDADKRAADYDAYYEELAKKHTVTVNDKATAKID